MSSRIGMVLTLISAIPLQAAQVPELPTRQRGATGLGEQLVERARRGQIAHRLHHARAQDVLHLQLVEVGKGLGRSEEHTSELQSRLHLVCRLLLEKKKKINMADSTQINRRA